MKLVVFSSKPYDKEYIGQAHAASKDGSALADLEIQFQPMPLNHQTCMLAEGADAVCAFVNDILSRDVLEVLKSCGVRFVLLRCAGFNNVDLDAAEGLGLQVANVPSYSPEAVAEFAVALIQTVNRHTHRAFNRVREGNFSLDGLLGRTLFGKTVGVIGTGRIGLAMARIMHGFGCQILAYDLFKTDALSQYGVYTSLEDLITRSDIISLHCPLTDSTRHLINADSLSKMKKGTLLVNTSRGGLIDTRAVIEALKSSKLGGLALDVYEGEGALFYNDHSADIIQDDQLMRLMTFPNVVVCGHQAFFTQEALTEIAHCTLRNLEDFVKGRNCKNSLLSKKPMARRESIPHRT